jgi:hypothetical protein
LDLSTLAEGQGLPAVRLEFSGIYATPRPAADLAAGRPSGPTVEIEPAGRRVDDTWAVAMLLGAVALAGLLALRGSLRPARPADLPHT